MNQGNKILKDLESGLEFTPLIVCGELTEKKPKKVIVSGHPPLAVYRLEDAFFVTEDECTHGNGSLSMGSILEKGQIRCPVHRGTFDIRTGQAVQYPCTEPLMTFPVKVKDGIVYAALEAGSLTD